MVCIILFIWISYSIIEGKREANFWHHKIQSKDYIIFKDEDRHPLFMLQRGLVLLLGSILVFYITSSVWLSLYILTMNSLIFSFFHNGMMYTERNKMSKMVYPEDSNKWVYSKKWYSQSNTSTARLTKIMTPTSRTIQMFIGLIGYIFYFFL